MNAIAANALLKTLEEPAASVRLVLTAGDPDLLLPTIRSRCQKRRIPMPAFAVALPWLAARGVDQPEVMLAAAGGRPIEALELIADGLDARFWQRLAPAVAAGDAGVLAGLPLPRAIEALQKLCLDALALAHGAAARFLPADSLRRGGGPRRCWPGRANSFAPPAKTTTPGMRHFSSNRWWPRARGMVLPDGAACTFATLESMTDLSARPPERIPRAPPAPAGRFEAQRYPAGVPREGRAVRGLHPGVRRGRLFVPTTRDYRLGDDVYLLLSLPDDAQRYPVAGKVGG
jgi:hypothetical protein